jgi:hypothetical protein
MAMALERTQHEPESFCHSTLSSHFAMLRPKDGRFCCIPGYSRGGVELLLEVHYSITTFCTAWVKIWALPVLYKLKMVRFLGIPHQGYLLDLHPTSFVTQYIASTLSHRSGVPTCCKLFLRVVKLRCTRCGKKCYIYRYNLPYAPGELQMEPGT